MKLKLSKAWYRKNAKAERGHEIGAGSPPWHEVGAGTPLVCKSLPIDPLIQASRLSLSAHDAIGVMIQNLTLTTESLKGARKQLFQAIEQLDTYLIVPPGKYKKAK